MWSEWVDARADGIGQDKERTTAKVRFARAEWTGNLTAGKGRIELETEGDVPGIDEETFRQQAQTAKNGCPVSKALAGPEIRLVARFVSAQRSAAE